MNAPTQWLHSQPKETKAKRCLVLNQRTFEHLGYACLEKKEREKDEESEKWRENRCFPPFSWVEKGGKRKTGTAREFSLWAYPNFLPDSSIKWERKCGGLGIEVKRLLSLPLFHVVGFLFFFFFIIYLFIYTVTLLH